VEEYITGTGQTLRVHSRVRFCDEGCTVHNPTDPHPNWLTHWRSDRGIFERICPHGVGHPDRDALRFHAKMAGEEPARWAGMHGCDGCCGQMAFGADKTLVVHVTAESAPGPLQYADVSAPPLLTGVPEFTRADVDFLNRLLEWNTMDYKHFRAMVTSIRDRITALIDDA
jgi:hypothetical protein